ncbi:MAG: ABC transporter substrate-binding protein [Chloroflexi bacterium]|nr:ABC transporter substrate-binding protein [Chloroflexota bacterium]
MRRNTNIKVVLFAVLLTIMVFTIPGFCQNTDVLVAETVKIIDMNGREIEIPTPENLEKVYFPSPLAQLMIYTINPDKMAGVVSEFSPEQKKFMPEVEGLQVFGNFDGGKTANAEQILASGAQAYIFMGPMKLDDKSSASADELQEKLGIPVIVVDGLFPQRAEAYRFLGKIFGEEERCEEMAKYCEETFKEVQTKVASIPDEARVTLYYAEKPNGLATEPDTSSHAAVFKYAGAKNVANVENTPGSGMTPVTLEQVLAWNPEVIFMGKGSTSPFNEITTNPDWANIDAVKNGRVYEAPNLPFSWIDRPPSSQQYLGLRYVANMLYPDIFKYDMVKETQKFFKLFYQIEISDEDANALLGIQK